MRALAENPDTVGAALGSPRSAPATGLPDEAGLRRSRHQLVGADVEARAERAGVAVDVGRPGLRVGNTGVDHR